MTPPKSERAIRAANRILSLVSLRAMGTTSGDATRPAREILSPLLVIPVLVERGARRREEDRVSRPGELRGPRDGAVHGPEALERDAAFERRLDHRRGLADRQDPSGRALDHGREGREVAVLVAPPQD